MHIMREKVPHFMSSTAKIVYVLVKSFSYLKCEESCCRA